MIDEDRQRALLGLHPDPHTLLGVHLEGDRLVVRVAEEASSVVWARPDGADAWVRLWPSRRAVHPPDGPARDLFEGEVAVSGLTWLRVQDVRGGAVTRLDPYTFLPSVTDEALDELARGGWDELAQTFGAQLVTHQGVRGTRFLVWAPSAGAVRIMGDFNGWSGVAHAMRKLRGGVWELFVPKDLEGARYKFEISTRNGMIEKTDPFARAMELRPQTASVVHVSRFTWSDANFMAERAVRRAAHQAMSIYEVHLGSWRRPKEAEAIRSQDPADQPFPTYRKLADELVDYVADLGFTHIELLPITEHPYDGSWGYQVSGYFAPTARHGSPDDFKYFVDRCHARGIGVILDWVPAHFPRDTFALGRFDGTALFEHWNPLRGEHRQWTTFIFDWGRPEVKAFLIASALWFLREFHVDGLRVDAVASMLYLDYGANHPGEWEPNRFGGRENLEAVAFLRELNDAIHAHAKGAVVAAEESTAWPGVTRPTYAGGLGFDFKWNMGWMHDSLNYFSLDPIFRSFRHNLLTFGLMYAFSERYVLPLSHDEVVHLKRSLFGRMPGDPWQQAATLRSLYAFMWSHPGKKLLFMGGELAQPTEWNEKDELPWWLLTDPARGGLHGGVQRLIRELNAIYRREPALYELDDEQAGFEWIDPNDAQQSVASFIRFARSELKRRRTGRFVVVVGNFTPVARHGYVIGVPRAGRYLELLNTDAAAFGGSNVGNLGAVEARSEPSHGRPFSVSLSLPPLSVLFLVPEDAGLATTEELASEAEPPAPLASEAGGRVAGEALEAADVLGVDGET